MNAILYVLKNGIPWRAMPHDLPHWSTVYHYFRQWQKEGCGRKRCKPWSAGTGSEKGDPLPPAPWSWTVSR
jgi:hypothetical protein